jgi:hypothetical protein
MWTFANRCSLIAHNRVVYPTKNYQLRKEAIKILTSSCDNNLIKKNILISIDENWIYDKGTNTIIMLNYFGTIAPSFFVEIIKQSFSTSEFVITIKITSEIVHLKLTDLEIFDLSILMWWNRTSVPSQNITELENGLYNISLTPIFIESGEDPILLNMTISEPHHGDKYYETYIAVEEEVETKIYTLSVDLLEQFFSEDIFNFTIYIYNTTNYNQGIDPDSIDVWWNGTKISSNNITSLGGGNYSISLEPIVVQLGEDPILLQITISDSEFDEPLHFEIYILVDPELIHKIPETGPSPPPKEGGGGKAKTVEEPTIPIVTLVAIGVGSAIAASAIAMILIRKRKLPKRKMQNNQ